MVASLTWTQEIAVRFCACPSLLPGDGQMDGHCPHEAEYAGSIPVQAIMPFKKKQDSIDYLKRRRLEYKRKLLGVRVASGGCEECGYFDHPEILQFHHKDQKEKLFDISSGNLFYRSWKKVLEEIKKCRILCPNCHSWFHFQETSLMFKEDGAYEKR